MVCIDLVNTSNVRCIAGYSIAVDCRRLVDGIRDERLLIGTTRHETQTDGEQRVQGQTRNDGTEETK